VYYDDDPMVDSNPDKLVYLTVSHINQISLEYQDINLKETPRYTASLEYCSEYQQTGYP
jgi:hypothetical protein